MANKYLDDVGLTHLWTKIKDYVSANSNKYTLPVATTSILGGVKLGSDTVQTVAAASVSTTASRTYAIQKNNNGQLVVNVPWTNTLPSADAADIVYWDTAQGTQLVIDLLSLFQTNSENSISRSPISYENNFFGNLLSQIRAGRKIAGIYIYNDTTVSGSQLIAYLQLSLVNGDTVTFTVYNLEFANEPTYGYIVEWTNGGNIFIAKTRLATQTDLNSYAKDNTVVHNNKDEWSINGVKQWNGIAYFQNSVTCNNILNTTKGINNDGIFQGGALDLHPESKVAYLPFYMNELAYLIEKGGSCTITGITSGTTTTNAALFDGTSGYSYFRVANTTDVVTILIKCHKAFYWNNCFGISFGASAFRAKDIKVELGYAAEIGGDPTDDMWKTVAEVTNYASGLFFKRPVTGPENPNKGGVPWNTIKITLTNFNGLDFRIAGIFTADTASEGLNTTLLGRKGGEMFGSITPYKDNTYNLGTDSKRWNQIFARNVKGTDIIASNGLFPAANGTGQLGWSGSRWAYASIKEITTDRINAVELYENSVKLSDAYESIKPLTLERTGTTAIDRVRKFLTITFNAAWNSYRFKLSFVDQEASKDYGEYYIVGRSEGNTGSLTCKIYKLYSSSDKGNFEIFAVQNDNMLEFYFKTNASYCNPRVFFHNTYHAANIVLDYTLGTWIEEIPTATFTEKYILDDRYATKDEIPTDYLNVLNISYDGPGYLEIGQLYDLMQETYGSTACFVKTTGYLSFYGYVELRNVGATTYQVIIFDVINGRKYNNYISGETNFDNVVNTQMTQLVSTEDILNGINTTEITAPDDENWGVGSVKIKNSYLEFSDDVQTSGGIYTEYLSGGLEIGSDYGITLFELDTDWQYFRAHAEDGRHYTYMNCDDLSILNPDTGAEIHFTTDDDDERVVNFKRNAIVIHSPNNDEVAGRIYSGNLSDGLEISSNVGIGLFDQNLDWPYFKGYYDSADDSVHTNIYSHYIDLKSKCDTNIESENSINLKANNIYLYGYLDVYDEMGNPFYISDEGIYLDRTTIMNNNKLHIGDGLVNYDNEIVSYEDLYMYGSGDNNIMRIKHDSNEVTYYTYLGLDMTLGYSANNDNILYPINTFSQGYKFYVDETSRLEITADDITFKHDDGDLKIYESIKDLQSKVNNLESSGSSLPMENNLLSIPGFGMKTENNIVFGENDAGQACIISPERKLCIGTDELDGDYMEYKFPDNKAGTIALLEDIPTVTKKYLHTIHITASTSSSGTTTVHMTLSFVNSVATAYTGVRGSLDTALYSAGFNSDTKLCVASGSFVSGSNVCTIKGARGSGSSGLYVYGTYSTYSGGTHTLTSISTVVGMYSATINDVVTEI